MEPWLDGTLGLAKSAPKWHAHALADAAQKSLFLHVRRKTCAGLCRHIYLQAYRSMHHRAVESEEKAAGTFQPMCVRLDPIIIILHTSPYISIPCTSPYLVCMFSIMLYRYIMIYYIYIVICKY
jgi:hypothetical protein